MIPPVVDPVRKGLLLLCLPWVLTQCVTDPASPGGSANRESTGTASPKKEYKSNNIADIDIPLLHSPELERRWGKPEADVYTDGSYRLIYRAESPTRMLSIRGQPGEVDTDGPEAPDYIQGIPFGESKRIKQEWSTVVLFGNRPTHYCMDEPEGGAEPTTYATVTFPVQRPGQPMASYSLAAHGRGEKDEITSQEKEIKYLESLFQTARFR